MFGIVLKFLGGFSRGKKKYIQNPFDPRKKSGATKKFRENLPMHQSFVGLAKHSVFPQQIQTYFYPIIDNNTSTGLLMGVNMGLPSENKCNCVVNAGNETAIGYYKLFGNTNVQAFQDDSNYTGSFIFWNFG